jgi:hypothetical protein
MSKDFVSFIVLLIIILGCIYYLESTNTKDRFNNIKNDIIEDIVEDELIIGEDKERIISTGEKSNDCINSTNLYITGNRSLKSIQDDLKKMEDNKNTSGFEYNTLNKKKTELEYNVSDLNCDRCKHCNGVENCNDLCSNKILDNAIRNNPIINVPIKNPTTTHFQQELQTAPTTTQYPLIDNTLTTVQNNIKNEYPTGIDISPEEKLTKYSDVEFKNNLSSEQKVSLLQNLNIDETQAKTLNSILGYDFTQREIDTILMNKHGQPDTRLPYSSIQESSMPPMIPQMPQNTLQPLTSYYDNTTKFPPNEIYYGNQQNNNKCNRNNLPPIIYQEDISGVSNIFAPNIIFQTQNPDDTQLQIESNFKEFKRI